MPQLYRCNTRKIPYVEARANLTGEELRIIDNLLFNYRIEQMSVNNWQEAERITKIIEKIRENGKT